MKLTETSRKMLAADDGKGETGIPLVGLIGVGAAGNYRRDG